jgi:hypothetical protein
MITSGARLPRYRIGPQIAAGSRARIFLAETASEPRTACLLKALKSTERESIASRGLLLEEATILRRLIHPSIEPLLEIDSSDSELFYTLQSSDGTTLRELQSIVSPAAWTTHALLELALAMFDALTFAHALGVPHGSLTADNVRICWSGRARLWGFGFAELACHTPHEEPQELNPGDRFAHDVGAAGRVLGAILGASSIRAPRDFIDLIQAATHPSPRCRPKAHEALSVLRAISARETENALVALLARHRTPRANDKTVILRVPVRARTAADEPTSVMGAIGPGVITAVILCGLVVGFLLTNKLPLI